MKDVEKEILQHPNYNELSEMGAKIMAASLLGNSNGMKT